MSRYVRIRWTPPWSRIWAQYSGKLPRVVRDLLTKLGVMGTSYAKRHTPVDTGNLRKRIGYTLVGATEMHIGTNVTYAPFILQDTGPYKIRVKHKKALAWVTRGHVRPASATGWKGARQRGWARYAKQVTHPGGKPVLKDTLDYLEPKIPKTVQQVLRKHGIV